MGFNSGFKELTQIIQNLTTERNPEIFTSTGNNLYYYVLYSVFAEKLYEFLTFHILSH
jgi:hypothetical protein